MSELTAMFTERPYVVAFLISFVVVAWAERGWSRMLFWLASGTLLGWLMEFSSVRTGFPFGSYAYHESIFPDELWLGGVPLFASLSFAFLTYFAYSVSCTLLSPLVRHGIDVQRRVDARVDGSLLVLALAVLITVWMDTVMDPVTHLGRYWFLGDLYAYDAGGVHFDVPLSNYAGWAFTAACIVFVNQRAGELLSAVGVVARGFWLPAKPLWALGSVLGNFGFMLGVAVYLVFADGVPDSEPVAGVLLSTVLLSAAFVLFAALMLWRGLTADRPPAAASRVAAPVPR